MTDLPIIVTAAGAQPQSPAALRAKLIAKVTAVRPGYTANLPGSLIEDISSTDTYALTQIDQGCVDFFNSLTPLGANAFLINQLGQMLGIAQGQATNTSVFVVFTGDPGQVIPIGFTVSDGTHQYTVQDGGIIPTGGVSQQLFCLATQPGSWAVPPSTVTQIATSLPPNVRLTVGNPEAGIPGPGNETLTSYRARVLQANLANAQGMTAYMKTKLAQVVGVQPRLVSAIQQTGGGWAIVCGGGDPYEVGNAIWRALFDISLLTGAILNVESITNAAAALITTDINHNYSVGQPINIIGLNDAMAVLNNVPMVVSGIVSPTSFTVTTNTTGIGAYTSGGILSPCLRNITVSLQNYPDVYGITFINPPQQTVVMTATWGTNALNFVSGTAVAQLGNPALVDYINSIPVGQPINLIEMQTAFAEAVSAVLPESLLASLNFTVLINGINTRPTGATALIFGDPSSYFFTTTAQVTVTQAG